VNSFFRELKQRRVYRVAIGYAVAAWLVIQVGSTVLPAFQVSPTILKVLIVMVALGFPVALVLAWAFDVTPLGIEKTPDGVGSARAENRRNGWLLAATGLLVAALIIGGYWLWHPWRMKSDIAEKSIAVLPLENLSDDKENAFFADGVQDDLLSSLAKIKELKVISRSSVMSYRNASSRNLREIGQQLGVSYLLEGSVRRAADRVLVNVALIDTHTERQIWVEHYDRTLVSSLTLQGELATEIAGTLRATLSPEEKTRVEEKPTENADAYVLYLRAREYQTRPTGLLQDYQMATSLYTQALALDPSFALAHARLSETLSYTYLNFQPTPEVSARARAEAEEALRLRPNSGEGNLARALCLYRTEKDYEAALAEMKIAARLLPSDAEIDFFSGAIRRRQGQWNESLASMQRALAGDPRSVLIAREILLTQSVLRDWPAAARAGDRAVALAPDLPLVRVERSYVDIWSRGNLAPLRAALAAVPPGVDPDGEITLARFDVALLARDFAAAERAVAAGAPETVETVFGAALPKSYLLGCIALARGEPVQATPLFESARAAMEAEALAFPRDPFRQAYLGMLYAYLGRKEDSLRLGRRAVELLPESKDAYYGPSVSGLLALIYARNGEPGQALMLIGRLLKLPGPLSPVFEGSITLSDLRLRWQWDPLRKDQRFQKIVTSMEPKTVRK
jgi:TolB-like protein/tetratricopeptide (TPR) repeat protein